MNEKPQEKLDDLSAQEANPSLLKDFVYFLLHNKKWWLLPLLMVLLFMGLLMFLSTSAVAPFIYTLF